MPIYKEGEIGACSIAVKLSRIHSREELIARQHGGEAGCTQKYLSSQKRKLLLSSLRCEISAVTDDVTSIIFLYEMDCEKLFYKRELIDQTHNTLVVLCLECPPVEALCVKCVILFGEFILFE